MGHYTEALIMVDLDKDTPKAVLDTIRYMIGDNDAIPEESHGLPIADKDQRFHFMLRHNSRFRTLKQCEHSGGWELSVHFDIKDYNDEIETFFQWLRPWIQRGMLNTDCIALSCDESNDEPFLHYKSGEVKIPAN